MRHIKRVTRLTDNKMAVIVPHMILEKLGVRIGDYVVMTVTEGEVIEIRKLNFRE